MAALPLVALALTSAHLPTFRLGGLFPRQRTSGLEFTRTSRRLAAFVMAVEEVNSRSDLLPHTNISFAVQDSKCSPGHALVGAHMLISESFGGAGVSALVGAACSSASAQAASYAKLHSVPQLSPSSTSATLSDSTTYPYFARVAPSDAYQSFALADLVEHQLKVSRVACVYSEDQYGKAGMDAFRMEAQLRRIDRLAVTSFQNYETNFSAQIEVLRKSGAAVIVLFCQTADTANFIQAVQAAGILVNVTWVGSEAATAAVSGNDEIESKLLGYLGLRPPVGQGDDYIEFLARLDAFQANVVGAWGCSNDTDDDGNWLWRRANGVDCIWPGPRATEDFYAGHAYDAVYTIAHALHGMLAVAPDTTTVDGDALFAAILASNFSGATGQLGFDSHGDRNRGIRYDVFSVGPNGTFQLGDWVEGSNWENRFTPAPGASYISVTGSSTVTDLTTVSGVLKLGVLCQATAYGGSGSKTLHEECDHILHAVDVINNKADGFYDHLLLGRTIITAVRAAGCVQDRAQAGWLELENSSPGGFDFSAVIGPPCSNDVRDLTSTEWRAARGRAVVISYASTAVSLGGVAGEQAHPNLARTVSPDSRRAVGNSKLCNQLGWQRLAILYDSSVWASGAAVDLKTRFDKDGVTVLQGHDGDFTVRFDLRAFDSGALHVSSLVASLQAVEAKVIIVITQPRVQRAFFSYICMPRSETRTLD